MHVRCILGIFLLILSLLIVCSKATGTLNDDEDIASEKGEKSDAETQPLARRRSVKTRQMGNGFQMNKKRVKLKNSNKVIHPSKTMVVVGLVLTFGVITFYLKDKL